MFLKQRYEANILCKSPQQIATCCNTLQHTVLQCVAVYCDVLHRLAQHAGLVALLQKHDLNLYFYASVTPHQMNASCHTDEYVMFWQGIPVAVCCSVLHCVAVSCSALHCVTLINALWFDFAPVAVCCSVLQCAEVCCSVLQCVVVCHADKYVRIWLHIPAVFQTTTCCSMLQRVAPCCSVVQCFTVFYSVLQCVAQCVAVRCSALQCVAVCCSMWQCIAVCCSVLQCVCVGVSYSAQCVAVRCSVFYSILHQVPPRKRIKQQILIKGDTTPL